jgi:4-hydroxybenzoate polyprenyltransferase
MHTTSLRAAITRSRETNRWWVYQRERFPVLAHGPVILAFSLSAVAYSALLRGATSLPGWKPCIVAFVSSFLSFLQLRIADEFKDVDEDARYRPYRPVPRGLISLRDLVWVWVGCIAVQLALCLWLFPRNVWLLAATWLYLGLMTQEFFARKWLKARPVVYMVSHIAIMPLVDFYATACDWAPAGYAHPPRGLLWFLLVSFFNGMVVEIGRKIRSPQDEETGVETYSFLWGARRAVLVWLAMMMMTACFVCMAAHGIRFESATFMILAGVVVIAAAIALRSLCAQSSGAGKRLETIAGLWSLVLYLSLGVAPLTFQHWRPL